MSQPSPKPAIDALRREIRRIMCSDGGTLEALPLAAPLLGLRPGPLLWVAGQADLYGAGIAGLGLDPGRFLFVRAGGDREVLWAMEEGLRCRGLAGVLGEVAVLSSRSVPWGPCFDLKFDVLKARIGPLCRLIVRRRPSFRCGHWVRASTGKM